jgi:hypothetical protein
MRAASCDPPSRTTGARCMLPLARCMAPVCTLRREPPVRRVVRSAHRRILRAAACARVERCAGDMRRRPAPAIAPEGRAPFRGCDCRAA